MKKLIALLLALVMVIGLVACGAKDAPAADAPAADAPAADAPAADAPAEDAPAAEKPVIAFVPKVIGQAWWDYVGEGVAEWAAENADKAEVIYKGPAEVDAAAVLPQRPQRL